MGCGGEVDFQIVGEQVRELIPLTKIDAAEIPRLELADAFNRLQALYPSLEFGIPHGSPARR